MSEFIQESETEYLISLPNGLVYLARKPDWFSGSLWYESVAEEFIANLAPSIIEQQQQNQQLTAENKALRAQINHENKAKELICELCSFSQDLDLLWWQIKAREIYYLLNKSPQQSLNHIKEIKNETK